MRPSRRLRTRDAQLHGGSGQDGRTRYRRLSHHRAGGIKLQHHPAHHLEVEVALEPPIGVGSRRLIGQQAVVIVDVPAGPSATGEVRLGREMWRAESADQTAIVVDTIVRVLDVRGTSVVVQTVSPESPTPGGAQ